RANVDAHDRSAAMLCQPERAPADAAAGVEDAVARRDAGQIRQYAVHVQDGVVVPAVLPVEVAAVQTEVAIDSPEAAVIVVRLVEVFDNLVLLSGHERSPDQASFLIWRTATRVWE